MVPNISKIFVLPAVRYLSDSPVMRVGPAFAFVLGCLAECDHGLPLLPVRVLFQGISAASVVETSDEGWEPCDSGVSS